LRSEVTFIELNLTNTILSYWDRLNVGLTNKQSNEGPKNIEEAKVKDEINHETLKA